MQTALAASFRFSRTFPFRGAALMLVVALHALAALWLLRTAPTMPATVPALAIELLPLAPAAETPQKPLTAQPRPAPRPTAPDAPITAPATPTTAAAAATPLAAAGPGPASKVTPETPVTTASSAPLFDAGYLQNPAPVYPPLSRRLGEQGRVVLRVRVQADGLPDEIALHTGSGSPRLDQAALETVRRWRFVPARQGNAAVTAWVQVPIAFTLKE